MYIYVHETRPWRIVALDKVMADKVVPQWDKGGEACISKVFYNNYPSR